MHLLLLCTLTIGHGNIIKDVVGHYPEPECHLVHEFDNLVIKSRDVVAMDLREKTPDIVRIHLQKETTFFCTRINATSF